MSSNVNEDAIRQVQKSTVIPPPKRTQEDIEREVAEARKGFYYEQQHEETKKYEFQRASDLDALLKRKQKVASVEVDVSKIEHSPAVPPTLPSPPRRSRGAEPAPATPAIPASKPKSRQPAALKVAEQPKPIVKPTPAPAPKPAVKPAVKPVVKPLEVPKATQSNEEDFMSKLLSKRRASGIMRETARVGMRSVSEG